MGRPFYPQEADDADLDWLISNFLYENPDYIPVEVGVLPLILLPFRDGKVPVSEDAELIEDTKDILTS